MDFTTHSACTLKQTYSRKQRYAAGQASRGYNPLWLRFPTD